MVIVDVSHKKIWRVGNLAEDSVAIMPSFLDDAGTTLLYSCLDSTKFIGGIAFCNNKPSTIHILRSLKMSEIGGDILPDETSSQTGTNQKISIFPISLHPMASPSGKHILYFFSKEYQE